MTTTIERPIQPGTSSSPALAAQPTRTGRVTLAERYARQARGRELRRDLLGVGAWSLIASSVALYLADSGLGQFATLGGAVTALGILAGLVATAFMALMLVLTARVPVIDATLGQDRATALHARLGRGMVLGLLAHGLLLIFGYSLSGRINPWRTFTGLWATSTDFVWACVAFAMFALVGVSSMVAVRRKYPYEAWFAIHLSTYAAIVASLPHQFSMSGILAPGTMGRAFWAALWLAVACVLLAYRIILPLISTFAHRLMVSSVEPTGADAVHITVTGRRLDRLEARGGQWLNWRFLTPQLALQPHPFSLSAHPTATSMRITVRNLGAGTARLMSLRPGTKVAVEGPYGVFTDRARTTDRVVLVGAGIGIAPVRALLEATAFEPGRAAVILRASTPDELYLLDEVRELCRAKGASLDILVGSRAGDAWVPAQHAGRRLTDYVPWAGAADVYVCGPTPWMHSFLADARACGVAQSRLHDELFAW